MKNNGVRTSAPVLDVPPQMPGARRLRIAMGTFVAVQATAASTSKAEVAVEAAFSAITAVVQRMHPYSADSDLARINHSRLLQPIAVHPSTCELLTLARRLHVVSDGVFDPCLPTRRGRLTDIKIAGDTVLCRAPVALDFGGIGKGYAVDCAVEVLLDHGCSAGLVNAGGDLRVFGPATEPIFLRSPTAGDLIQIELSNAALAVSDARSKHRPPEHQGYYVREARTQQPLTTEYAAVTAKRAVIADALAKCVLLCPRETAERALHAFEATRLPDGVVYAAIAANAANQ